MIAETISQAGEPGKKFGVGRKMSSFGQSIPFAQAFPMLAALKTTVWIRPHGGTEENPQEQHFKFRKPPGEYIRCPKKGCTNGGWCIGDIVRDMIARRETHQKIEGKCNGLQLVIGPKFRKCGTHFTAEIELGYKPKVANAMP
jgi:hypothetical protein